MTATSRAKHSFALRKPGNSAQTYFSLPFAPPPSAGRKIRLARETTHNTHVYIHACVHTHAHRPDCKKKVYVRLAPDYDALDVANKVSLCFIL